MFCFDVCKLYPSVPKQEVSEAYREGLNTRSKSIVLTEEILKMIKVVLENKNFNLGNKNYVQTKVLEMVLSLARTLLAVNEKLEYHEQQLFF